MKLIKVEDKEGTKYFTTLSGIAKYVGKTPARIKMLLGGFGNPIDGFHIQYEEFENIYK